MWTSTSRLLASAALAFAASARAAEPALDSGGSLDQALLVRAVLERNPGVEAARQAARAADDEAPQVGALDDPTLSLTASPVSFIDTPIGYSVQIGQMFPLGGKLRLRS